MDDMLLYLSPDDVMLAAKEVDAVDAVREALAQHAAGQAEIAPEAYLAWSPPNGGEARSISMPGLLDGNPARVGVKIINANTANPASGLPRASGLTVIFDSATARPRCVLAASHISALRTAAVSVLAAQMLINTDATRAAVIGAGALARAHCQLVIDRIPQITEILVFDAIPDRASKLCRELKEQMAGDRADVKTTVTAQSAVQQCDLLITCTTTRQPYVEREWLAEGAVAINVSLDDLCEEVLMTADRLYVDDWALIADDEHRLLGRLARAGRVLPPGTQHVPSSARAATGTLGQLVRGECQGRQSAPELCVVNPFGLAIEDVAIAHRIYEVAQHAGIGRNLPF